MGTSNRPLSPHLQVYRWQITMVLSILHRASGVFLSMGSLVLGWWLVAVALGGDYFLMVSGLLMTTLGQLALFAWTAAFYYHLSNGIRHLLWDAGWGFEMNQVYFTGWSVVIVSAGLTLFTWWPRLEGLL